MSNINKKKLFIPRKLSGEGSRWEQWNKEQPIVDGRRINQYDSDGIKQGYWEYYHNNGKLLSKGSYINDKRDGYWESYWDTGEVGAKGSLINGKKDGIWEWYWNTGEIMSKELYANDILVKDIPLNESKKLFIPRKLSDDDSRYSEWNNSQPIKDGKRINQYDSEGRKQGVWEERDDDDDDEIGQGLYLNNERIGVWEFYDTLSDQIFAKGQYVDGYPDGIWEYYNPLNGELEGKSLFDNGKYVKQIPLTESKTPSFLLKEEMVLIREGNVQDYINNVISKIKNLPYETKKKYLTIAISTLLGYTSYPVIQSIFDKSPDKEAKEIVRRVMDKKDKVSMFNDGTKFRLSKKGFQHIMDEEKPKLIAYALGDGKITVGYGHAEPVATTKLKVGQKITKEQAKLYLKEDLKIAADGVRRMFRDWKKQNKNYKITQDMFDALVSMAFNMGVSGLRNTNLVDHLRDGDYKTAGQLIKKTNIDNDSFPGLEKRRYKESDMFLSYLSKPTNVNT